MSISHWGIFPGWFESKEISPGTGCAVFVAVDWDKFCAAVWGI